MSQYTVFKKSLIVFSFYHLHKYSKIMTIQVITRPNYLLAFNFSLPPFILCFLPTFLSKIYFLSGDNVFNSECVC